MDFLHGVETIETEIGGQAIDVVKSSVIAIVGIAPVGVSQALVQCNTAADDAQFGKPLPGFNIPKTLQLTRAIAGNTPVLVVNTFNPTSHTTQVTLEAQTVTGGKLKLANAPIGAVNIFQADGTTAAPYVLNTDYTLDEYGNFQVISNAIADTTVLKFSYKKLNASAITPTILIGGTDVNGLRTGLALFDIAFNTVGFNPKIFVSPGYMSLSAMVAAMSTVADKFRAVYLVDAPYGTTVAGAIAGRGVNGSIVFNTSDERAFLLYPYGKAYDNYSNADVDYPASAFVAALIAKTDNDLGYWYSPSNKEISAMTGTERVIQWSINDSSCEANQLNAVGISTLVAGFGTGTRLWGNRNASFPISSSVKNFVSVRRTDDVVIESMEQAALPFVDKPITQALIDTMRESGNTFMRTLIQRGAILPGSTVNYNRSDNSAGELAAGKITFERVYMIPTPAERITYKDVLDISLLNQFK